VSCRQERELNQLVEYEVKRSRIQAKAEAKIALQEDRAKEQAEMKAEKEKQWRAALRAQEMKRLAVEKEEEAKLKLAEKVSFLLCSFNTFPSIYVDC
jgi:hypothetical protein